MVTMVMMVMTLQKALLSNLAPEAELPNAAALVVVPDHDLVGGYLGVSPPPTSARMLQRKSISTFPMPPLLNSLRNWRARKGGREGNTMRQQERISVVLC